MSKKNVTKLVLFVVFCLAGSLFVVKPADATAQWCGMLAPALSTDCTAGQDYSTCTVVDRANVYPNCSSSNLKQAFINNLTYYASNGGFQQTDALWIESMIGSNWQNRVNNQAVKASIYDYTYNLNTAYDPSGCS